MILSSTSVMFMTWRTGTPELQGATENVDLKESAEVADMAIVVDGWAAGVDAQFFPIRRDEFIHLSRKGVEEAHRHWCDGRETHISGQNRGQLVFPIVAVGITGGIPVTFVVEKVTLSSAYPCFEADSCG